MYPVVCATLYGFQMENLNVIQPPSIDRMALMKATMVAAAAASAIEAHIC